MIITYDDNVLSVFNFTITFGVYIKWTLELKYFKILPISQDQSPGLFSKE